MKNLVTILFFCIFVSSVLSSRTLKVGEGYEYTSIAAAAALAQPGDSILLYDEIITQGEYIANLKGSENKYIYIMSGLYKNVLFQGSSTAIQFTDIEYVKFKNLSFQGQTANGVNIDDGGDYSTPSRFISFDSCIWYGMNASGNNDCLKLSGLDYFHIQDCNFKYSSEGGSFIDMVGCHNGIIEKCRFINGGSNCIQAKGGTSLMEIRRNEFINGGQRAVNIGGSTGMEFFRPLDAEYEAMHIGVYSNIFWGATAAAGFVGAYQCFFHQNTVVNPEKWSLRILQENNDIQLGQCSNNSVMNNIFYFSDAAASPAINIGPNTIPESFFFSNNLWYNYQTPEGDYPNIPNTEFSGIYGLDPLFTSLLDPNLKPMQNSPAIGGGTWQFLTQPDFFGNDYTEPVTIGAINGNIIVSVENNNLQNIKFYPQPAKDFLNVETEIDNLEKIQIINLKGEILLNRENSLIESLHFNLSDFSSGIYFIKFTFKNKKVSTYPLYIVK